MKANYQKYLNEIVPYLCYSEHYWKLHEEALVKHIIEQFSLLEKALYQTIKKYQGKKLKSKEIRELGQAEDLLESSKQWSKFFNGGNLLYENRKYLCVAIEDYIFKSYFGGSL